MSRRWPRASAAAATGSPPGPSLTPASTRHERASSKPSPPPSIADFVAATSHHEVWPSMTETPETTRRLTLREAPLPVRLVLSLFLISTGIGYFSALVQLHFQHARSG